MTAYQFLESSKRLVRDSETGAGAIDHSVAIERVSRLVSVTVALDAAPTTSESLTITVNNVEGAAYDILLLSEDLSIESVTSLVYSPDDEILLAPGDSVDVAYTNTDAGTYGSQVTVVEMG